ncbi:eukaryotic translation initiation factor 3-like protein [Haematococcus lacustris]
MADDWEDWENDSFAPPVAAAPANPASALAADLDMSKFAKEKEAEALVEDKKFTVPESQPKKKEDKKYLKEVGVIDTPLDDPVEEKLRQQRLVEESDLASFKEMVGAAGQQGPNLDTFLPKSLKDFEELAATLASRYVVVHRDSKQFKAFLKALFKACCAPLPSSEVKDVETSLAGLRSEKFKAEAAEAAAKKGTKKQLNVGKSAGLDDYMYEDAGNGDDFDFM